MYSGAVAILFIITDKVSLTYIICFSTTKLLNTASYRRGSLPSPTATCSSSSLLYYYKDWYDYDINWQQACNPVVDVDKYQYLNSIVLEETSKPYGVFYFSHSSAITKLLARWGL